MTKIDVARLLDEYKTDRQAVSKCAARHGVTVQAVYYQMKRAGIDRRQGGDASKGTQARENNPNWKDGTTVRSDGYVLENKGGRQHYQHRLVAARMLGRELKPEEQVHHINGDRADNRPENLEVCASHADHMRYHCDPDVMRERGRRGLQVRYAALKARGHDGG